MRNKRGALEFSFAWIFAILAGVFILILAVYGVIKFVNLEKTRISSETAKDIGVLTNPLESSFESARRSMIIAGSETRVYTECNSRGNFGKQIIKTSQNTYGQWGDEGANVSFQNRYVFSKNPVQGKSFYLFSKPFNLPFKVADLIYLTSTKDKYCFVNAPRDVKNEINDLIGEEISPYENFVIEDRKINCPEGSTTVCFNIAGCDSSVHNGYVQKMNGRLYYEGDALMYAAIFSNKEDYECQLIRLMNRTQQLFELYRAKSRFVLDETGCNSELDIEIMQMISLLKGFEDSRDFDLVNNLAQSIGKKNENAKCALW